MYQRAKPESSLALQYGFCDLIARIFLQETSPPLKSEAAVRFVVKQNQTAAKHMTLKITPEYLESQGLSIAVVSRFFSNVLIGDGCWIWTGSKSWNGYGRVWKLRGEKRLPNSRIGAHILSWILFNGPAPTGLKVLHNCPTGDNPACVNPTHLWAGTTRQNNQDMASKLRHGYAEYHGMAKVTIEQVLEMRSLDGIIPRTILAKRFGLDYTHVWRILTNSAWKITERRRAMPNSA